MQRISDPRFSGQSSRNLRMFRELCGPAAYKNVLVLTTFWDQVPSHDVGVKREEQLKSKFFAKLVEGGAQFMRHDCTVKSARKVLRHILPMLPTVTLIQTQIRDQGLSLIETAAGSVHSKEVEKALANYKKEIADLKAEMETVIKSNNAARQELEKELAGLQKSLAAREQEHAELKMGLEEERELRKRLETEAEKLRAQILKQIEPLGNEEKARIFQKFQEGINIGIKRALDENRKRSIRQKLTEIAEDIPLLPRFIGKPILGGIGLGLDLIKAILR